MSFVEGSTAPEVIAALLAVIAAATALPDPIDGPTQQAKFQTESINIGYQDDDAGANAIAADPPEKSAGYQAQTEGYTVLSQITVLAGSPPADLATARARVFELWRGVLAAVRADSTLGGLVLSATPGAWQLDQKDIGKGLAARIKFGIDIEALVKG